MKTRALQRFRSLLGRAFTLRCPRCGRAPLFRGFFSMYAECIACDLRFEREQGYFVGAIYINYAATAVVALAGYFALDHFAELALSSQLILWGAFSIAFPLIFFRYSRSLWLCLDFFFDPEGVVGDRQQERRR
ncbi:MAG: DUF983 domain-containing protein [candidate division NC10 bacterium]|nr:DUF983 domain-containing protein [candidate division NC10 bacterium]